jgi:hypothetical protein
MQEPHEGLCVDSKGGKDWGGRWEVADMGAQRALLSERMLTRAQDGSRK